MARTLPTLPEPTASKSSRSEAALESLQKHASIFHALSDARRLRILDLLRAGEQCVCDLQATLDCGQSLLSFHLKTLRDANLIRMRREGRWSYYELDHDVLTHAEAAVAAYRVPAAAKRRLPTSCCA